jgi:hypothetical protein
MIEGLNSLSIPSCDPISPSFFARSPIFSFFQSTFYIGFVPDLITGAKNV